MSKEKIKTLLLYSEGSPGRNNIIKNTLVKGFFKNPASVQFPDRLLKNSYFRRIDAILKYKYFETLGYINDWRDEINRAPELDVTECNILNLIHLYKIRRKIKYYDFIIILHSAFADCIDFLIKRSHWFHGRRGKLAAFISNEYEFMDRKFTFLKEAGVDFIYSQLPDDTAKWLYASFSEAQVLFVAHALNPSIYYPGNKKSRSVDIGFIGAQYPLWVGDTMRQDFIDKMVARCPDYDLTLDIRYKNIPRHEWAEFLRNSYGILGAEPGSFFLDKKGVLIENARKYMDRHPDASLNELINEVYSCTDVEYISGKGISSRHFEPMGTKTCQILLEGRYCDLIKPGVHYLSVKPDFSNFSEVIKEFCDEERRREITEHAYEHVMNAHTYRHRIVNLVEAFLAG